MSAAWKFVAVCPVVAPMVNWPAAGGDDEVAVSVRFCVVPSGRLKVNVTLSPGLGLPPVKSTRTLFGLAGWPLGPETVPPPVRLDDTLPSFMPNGELSASSAIETCEAAGDVTSRRPCAPTPSACWRSFSTCVKPSSPTDSIRSTPGHQRGWRSQVGAVAAATSTVWEVGIKPDC